MSGSNWRIRNVTLGYTLPQQFAARVGASSARLYATANEPYIHFKYDYFDPESFEGGTAFRTLQIGADVSF